MMDNFTQTLLELAYQECKRKQVKLSVANVVERMNEYWAMARDVALAMWAKRIIEQIPHSRLADKLDIVFDLLIKAGVDCEWPWEKDEIVPAVARGLATLRWINLEAAGRTPPRAVGMDDEIEAWLVARDTRLLPLWPELGSLRVLGAAQ